MTETETEPATCPEAVQMTAVLLLGIPGPQPYCPTPRRQVLKLSARDKDIDQLEPPPGELGPMDPILSTSAAADMCDISPFIFLRRAKMLGLEPYGWEGQVTYWSEEQVRAVDHLVQGLRHG